jgi:hypothetical protein
LVSIGKIFIEFWPSIKSGATYIVKISNAAEPEGVVDFQIKALKLIIILIIFFLLTREKDFRTLPTRTKVFIQFIISSHQSYYIFQHAAGGTS